MDILCEWYTATGPHLDGEDVLLRVREHPEEKQEVFQTLLCTQKCSHWLMANVLSAVWESGQLRLEL